MIITINNKPSAMNDFRNYVVYALLLVLSFSVSCTHERERNDLVLRNAVKDVDGNKYDAVKIGKQVWMKSNLRTTHFRDKSPVPQGDIFYHNKQTWGSRAYAKSNHSQRLLSYTLAEQYQGIQATF